MKFEQEFTVMVVDNGFLIKIDTFKPDYIEPKTLISKDSEEVKQHLDAWLKNVGRK